MSQIDSIYEYLKKGHSITPLEALQKFGCFRLAAIIFELRGEGHNISTTLIPKPDGSKKFARYKLERN